MIPLFGNSMADGKRFVLEGRLISVALQALRLGTVPDGTELGGGEIPSPPARWPGWAEWAVDHWPSCTDS
jgi:hypothetical protein